MHEQYKTAVNLPSCNKLQRVCAIRYYQGLHSVIKENWSANNISKMLFMDNNTSGL